MLANGDKPGLLDGKSDDVAHRKKVAPVETTGQVKDRCTLDDGVVDVEKRRRRRVAGRRTLSYGLRHSDLTIRHTVSLRTDHAPQSNFASEWVVVEESVYSAHVGTTSEDPRITLIGKPGCHLCDDARTVVEAVAEDTGTGWRELSILEDPDLAARYAEQIPVVLVDGEPHDFWRVDEQRLRSALAGRRRWFGRRQA
jgi:hypothetical protein